MSILVVGAGGIGGVLTSCLVESGREVLASTTNPVIHRAVSAEGYRVRDEGGTRVVRGPISLGLPDRTFDAVVLATQPPQVEAAAREAARCLAPNGKMVVLQNGLCEERVARIVGEERVVGAVVAWGATMPEPGVYERTAQGGFTLGSLDGRATEAELRELVAAFEAVGPTEITANLLGKRWSKLAINCAISSLGTVGGDRLGALMTQRHVRRLALEIMSEVVAVSKALSVRLEKVSGTLDLDFMALTDEERRVAGSPGLLAKHSLLLAVGFRYRRMRSSMLSAIERGREPAVDFLNGEIVTRGQELGVPTPVNAAIRDEVWAIARKERAPDHARLRELYERTGPHGA